MRITEIKAELKKMGIEIRKKYTRLDGTTVYLAWAPATEMETSARTFTAVGLQAEFLSGRV